MAHRNLPPLHPETTGWEKRDTEGIGDWRRRELLSLVVQIWIFENL